MVVRRGTQIELAGLRIQVDPVVLLYRVLSRQIRLLAAFALVGGFLTAVVYLKTPKKYEARSNILIRYEVYSENYLQRLLNVAVGYLSSDTEMMTTINELNLYTELRSKFPYEISLRRLRDQLVVDAAMRNIQIRFKDEDRVLAQKVVAFTTERLLGKMADLNESPFDRKMDAVDRGLSEIGPKKSEAEARLFDFQSKYPEVAIQMPAALALAGELSPLAAADLDIRAAEQELALARQGRPELRARMEVPRTPTPGYQRLLELEGQLRRARQTYTENHPEVIRLSQEVRDQEQIVEREAAEATPTGAPTGASPEAIQQARIAQARMRLDQALAAKVELEKKAIRKPQLQREWADLSMRAATLSSQYRTLLDDRAKIQQSRLQEANAFQENFQLVDPARVPELPSEPNKAKFAGVGMVLTAILGLGAAVVREALRQTYASGTELEELTGLSVLASLPDIGKEEPT